MNQEVKERDYKIDILRFIAIICIILSHTKPPETIFLLRNFDVTLMVMIMGASFYLSNNNKNINYSNYIIKRFYRLIVSTWIFLFIFFFNFIKYFSLSFLQANLIIFLYLYRSNIFSI